MHKRKYAIAALSAILSVCLFFSTIPAYAAAPVLKQGMQGPAVTQLQKSLKTLGYFSIDPTGYFGTITNAAVKKLQGKCGIDQDGIVGPVTQGKINQLLARPATATTLASASRGSYDRDSFLMPWFGGVENFFKIGDKAVVLDVDTGLSFNIQRSYGYNHSDCETLTAKDTAAMKKIYGGEWSWARRAIIVTVNGRKIAASMAGMPHAGVDSQPADIFVNWRSEGYGAGTNLDKVKGNNMDGHFDIHFLGSKTHGTDRVDENHQAMVQKAADWAAKNY